MLQARTEEQQDYIKSLAEKESCDGKVTVLVDSINYCVDSCFDVELSFDTMAKIVAYLRNEDGKRRGKAIRAAIKSKINKLWVVGDTIYLKGADPEKVEAFILSLAENGYDTKELLNEYKQTGKITI